MIGKAKACGRGKQQSDHQTVVHRCVKGGKGGDDVGNYSERRISGSRLDTTNSHSDVVNEAMTAEAFGEQFLCAIRERRADRKQKKMKTEVRKLVHKWREMQTSVNEISTQVKAKQAELYPLYHSYLSTRGITAGVVHQMFVIDFYF